MRRVMAMAAFALMLAVPLWAQHGGGGGHGGGFGGGAHAGGFGGGHAGGFGGGGFSGRGFSGSPSVHTSSGPLSSHGYSRGYSQLPPTYGFTHPPTGGFTPPTSPLVRQPFAGSGFGRGYGNGYGRNGLGYNGYGRAGFHNGGTRFHIRTYPDWWGYGNGYGYPYAYGYPYGYWDAGYFDPWWWDSEDNSNDNSDYNDNLAIAEQMNQDSLQQQQMLQQELMDSDRDAYYGGADNRGGYNSQAQEQDRSPNYPYGYALPPLDPERMQQAVRNTQEQTADSIMRPTVLVFRDQHKEEIGNYAIVGQTLWEFAQQKTIKIPLSDLDIPATVKANEDRGVTFSVPSSDEG